MLAVVLAVLHWPWAALWIGVVLIWAATFLVLILLTNFWIILLAIALLVWLADELNSDPEP
jgi:hypothetical protein